MNLPRSQPGPQTVTRAGEAKKRMEPVFGNMAIVGNSFLLAVGRVLGGIQINVDVKNYEAEMPFPEIGASKGLDMV